MSEELKRLIAQQRAEMSASARNNVDSDSDSDSDSWEALTSEVFPS